MGAVLPPSQMELFLLLFFSLRNSSDDILGLPRGNRGESGPVCFSITFLPMLEMMMMVMTVVMMIVMVLVMMMAMVVMMMTMVVTVVLMMISAS